MTTDNNARKAHKVLDDLLKGNMVLDEEREFLRSALPERPKQKTLEEITEEVKRASGYVTGNYWGMDMSIHNWLNALVRDLEGLEDAPATEPAHPEFLETETDYRYAPVGTVVTMDGVGSAWVKEQYGWPGIRDSIASSAYTMAGLRRRVLRWGWGGN